MGQDIALLEQRIAEQRRELQMTVSAIVYQADLRHRLPEYVEAVVQSTASATGRSARKLGRVASTRGVLLASLFARTAWYDVLIVLRAVRAINHSAFVLVRSGAARAGSEFIERRSRR